MAFKDALDCLGRKLEVGDTIAYCISAGRSQVQNFYEILDITESPRQWMKEYPRIKAKFVGGHSWRSSRPARNSYLEFPRERAIKMPKDLKLPEVWPA